MMMKFLIMILVILISMGFYLLIERKMMGLIHYRLGPKKVLFLGLLQFLIDLFKLIFKELNFMYMYMFNYFYLIMFILLMSLIFWVIMIFNYIIYFSNYFFIMVLFISMFKMVLMLLFLLKKKSIYIQISYIRILVQFVSFDMLIVLIIIIMIMLIKSFNIMNLIFYQNYLVLFFMSFYILNIWVLCILMEILRLPFDFYESESELISGFNLELGSFMFMIIFMVEYLDMIFFINLTVMMFFFFNYLNMFILIFLMIFLWIRLFFIRYRYDLILFLMWKILIYFLLMKLIFFINLFI